MAYASYTTTRRNLAALKSAGWALLVSPTGCLPLPEARARLEGWRFGLDNGAWTAHQQGTAFDADAFWAYLRELGQAADWVVVPDIVEGGTASLVFSLEWLPRVLESSRVALLAVQDGMAPDDVAHLLGGRVGLFVGGSTDWKERTLPQWGRLARECGCYLHVGRVNSSRRIFLCSAAGADSFDGTSASRFSVNVRHLDNARRQMSWVLS